MHPILCRPIGRHLHTNTSAPVHHGGVAGVDVDADAVARFGISGAADGVQALQMCNIRIKLGSATSQESLINQGESEKKLTATKSTFFSEDLGMVNGSHLSWIQCFREEKTATWCQAF